MQANKDNIPSRSLFRNHGVRGKPPFMGGKKYFQRNILVLLYHLKRFPKYFLASRNVIMQNFQSCTMLSVLLRTVKTRCYRKHILP